MSQITEEHKERGGVTAFFAGSFNPFTKGHGRIVERALAIFPRVVICIGVNWSKLCGEDGKEFPADILDRLEKIKTLYAQEPRVEVIASPKLTVDAAGEFAPAVLLRAVRSVKDYEYELAMADVNRQISGIDTVTLFAEPEYASISSSVVRELQSFGMDVGDFLMHNS